MSIIMRYVGWCGTVACIHLDLTIKLLTPEVRDCPCTMRRPLRRDRSSCISHVYDCVLQHDWYAEMKWLHTGLQVTNVSVCKYKTFWNLSVVFIVTNIKNINVQMPILTHTSWIRSWPPRHLPFISMTLMCYLFFRYLNQNKNIAIH